jgi:hypothetical protein
MSSKSYQHAVLNEADDDKKEEVRMIKFQRRVQNIARNGSQKREDCRRL